MNNNKQIKNPIIKSYVNDFADKHEISKKQRKDEHLLFESYINDAIVSVYGNDANVSYEDMETGSAFGIDGVAIFVADKLVQSVEDVDYVVENLKRFDVEFYFIQTKTSEKIDRQELNDFFTGVRRFFDFDRDSCDILELDVFWETAKYIFTKASRFKENPKLNTFFVSLDTNEDEKLKDEHILKTIEMGVSDLEKLSLFGTILSPKIMGLKSVMELHRKNQSDLEISISMTKTPVAYPKDMSGKIKNGYYGLIRLEEFIKLLSDEIDGKKVLRRGIFDDNIRYYLGADEKIEVNHNMKNQLVGEDSYLFGLLNNGITIIGDDIKLNSEELTLVNYQIVNGCQTSNVIFESLDSISETDEIYLPVRFIATTDEETKNSIIKATNSQTTLKPEQLAALAPIQKNIEEYYRSKEKERNSVGLYYERRTEQYRDDNISKTKIINIPIQIKATSAMFLNLPHEVSGQYGKVERNTRNALFNENDLKYINIYYSSGLTFYKVERYVRNNYDRKYFKARWHLMMIIKYLLGDGKDELGITKFNSKISHKIEEVVKDDTEFSNYIEQAIAILNKFLEEKFEKDIIQKDRKLFERKETTEELINYTKSFEVK
ncbi:AIPR protein [Streptococcus mitis]|uniref:AIPR protein n=1 Tax=Streptococcus mitis TaxID=28037 RepID=A0A428I3V3_STRMT|nr:AIPR family protein [Streptococcus mitis]RSK05647.1 AIPR protein [Streptococcus mitis]